MQICTFASLNTQDSWSPKGMAYEEPGTRLFWKSTLCRTLSLNYGSRSPAYLHSSHESTISHPIIRTYYLTDKLKVCLFFLMQILNFSRLSTKLEIFKTVSGTQEQVKSNASKPRCLVVMEVAEGGEAECLIFRSVSDKANCSDNFHITNQSCFNKSQLWTLHAYNESKFIERNIVTIKKIPCLLERKFNIFN